MARIFLIGFMGVGKTTLGRRLAERINHDFIDLDQAIETRAKRSISELFDVEGEAKFRELEFTELERVLIRENVVIATGGGTPTLTGAMESMSEAGTVIWLKASTRTIISRLAACTERPLLKKLNPQERLERVESMLASREPLYNRADFALDTDHQDPESLVALICARIGSSEESR
tara:strand:- start:476 stop:1003 length:528 start_codon:yes stop_codon:yes gene_type:complete